MEVKKFSIVYLTNGGRKKGEEIIEAENKELARLKFEQKFSDAMISSISEFIKLQDVEVIGNIYDNKELLEE